jgi:hypothetical protein
MALHQLTWQCSRHRTQQLVPMAVDWRCPVTLGLFRFTSHYEYSFITQCQLLHAVPCCAMPCTAAPCRAVPCQGYRKDQ